MAERQRNVEESVARETKTKRKNRRRNAKPRSTAPSASKLERDEESNRNEADSMPKDEQKLPIAMENPKRSGERGEGTNLTEGGAEVSLPEKETPKAVERRRRVKEDRLTLEELETEQFIFFVPKGKRSQRFPDDAYYCRACNLHLRDDNHCQRHVNQRSHEKHVKARREILKVKKLPKSTESQLWSLTCLLEDLYEQHGISETEETSRNAVGKEINDLIQSHLTDCEVILYGSSLNDFGLKKSNINLLIYYTKSSKQTIATAMMAALQLLKSSDLVSHVKGYFDDTLPRICFTHKKTALQCEICAGQGRKAIKLTGLLRHLSSLDRRARILGIAFRLWANLCKLDEPRNCTLPAVSYPLMVVFFLQRCEPPVLPVLDKKLQFSGVDGKMRHGSNENDDDDLAEDAEWDDAFEKKGLWQSKNSESLGSLWLNLLKFYLVDTDIEQVLVSITDADLIERESRGIPNRRIAIEDPFLPRKNLANTMNSQRIFEYFLQTLRRTLLYFASNKAERDPTKAPVTIQSDETRLDDAAATVVKAALTSAFKEIQIEKKAYEFSPSHFCGSSVPPACCLCRSEGHTVDNCPEEMPVELRKLPPLTVQHKYLLDQVCIQVLADLASTVDDEKERRRVLDEIQEFVSSKYNGCKLTLFGSSENGFGFRNSDMDISLTDSTQTLDPEEVVRNLAGMFKKKRQEYSEIHAIPQARIPIVKFCHRASGLEGDISLANALAQRNTAMLRLYCALDSRVKTLGYCIKAFAKLAEIGDAARGSLSSYAYILMVLHYLQRTTPPVIPCLQEIYEGDEKPEVECEGWNSYYCSSVQLIKERWGQSKNTQSAGELWLGLLRYYCEFFDWKRMVVSPKQLSPLTKFEKSWSSRPFAIEDPFKLSHNLGGGITRKMRNYILECFANARAHFGRMRPLSGLDICDHFFNPIVLTNNCQPPNDKSCRDCGQYGHFAADCPNKEGGREKSRQAGHRQKTFYRHLKQSCIARRPKDPPRREEEKDANTAFFESLLARKQESKLQSNGPTPRATAKAIGASPAPALLQLVPDQVVRKQVLEGKAQPQAVAPQTVAQPPASKPALFETRFPSQPTMISLPMPVARLASAQARPTTMQSPFPPQSQTAYQYQIRPAYSQPRSQLQPSNFAGHLPRSQPQGPPGILFPAAQQPQPSHPPGIHQHMPLQQQQQQQIPPEQMRRAWIDYYVRFLEQYRQNEMQLREVLMTRDTEEVRSQLSTNLQYQQACLHTLKTLEHASASPGSSFIGTPQSPGRL